MGGKKHIAPLLLTALLLHGLPPASAAHPAKMVSGFLSNAASLLLKRAWSLKPTTKTAVSGRPMVRFESGYTVETVFDGSKLGIEPYSVEVTQSGELLLLDSVNSNIYRISLPLSRHSRPKLVAGSPEGFAGHIDGRSREARMNHPKGFAVDDRGNIYVADAMNMAIRKISDAGVATTIAGGKSNRGGHVDGPSDEARFSSDFEVHYIASSCSLLIIDRGNRAIREIQLHFDDCAYRYETGFPLGVALLLAAGFFGYMLALLQHRVGGMVSSQPEPQTPTTSMPPYQKQMKWSLRSPLIPTDEEAEKQEEEEEDFFASIGKLLGGAGSPIAAIFGAVFRRKSSVDQYKQQQRKANSWPVQESYAIPHDEPPPPVETRTSTPRKNYAFMSKEPEKIHHIRHGWPYLDGRDGDQQQMQQQQQQHLQQHRQHPSGSQTFYEPSCEAANEVVFGAVQESDSKRRTVDIKAVNYGDVMHGQYGLRYRNNYVGYNNNY